MFGSLLKTNAKPRAVNSDNIASSTDASNASWVCSMCTYQNLAVSTKCEICETMKNPTSPVKPNLQSASSASISNSTGFAPFPRPPKANHASTSHKIDQFPKPRVPAGKALLITAVHYDDGNIARHAEMMERQHADYLLAQRTNPSVASRSPSSPAHTTPTNDSSSTPSLQNPTFSPTDGALQGSADFKQSMANAGLFGGERVRPPTESSATPYDNARVGYQKHGRQRPEVERIDPTTSTSLADGGGARVNPSTAQRIYSLSSYEKSVYIDEKRHELLPEQREPTSRNDKTYEQVGVPFEVASVASKIRNMHKVGGERVKEMDHFVATVETPVQQLWLPADNEAGKAVKAATPAEIGEYIQSITKSEMMKQSIAIEFQNTKQGEKPWTLWVQEQYTTRTAQGWEALDPSIRIVARVFRKVLIDVLEIILNRGEIVKELQMYYVNTIRADELVCSYSSKERKLFVNLMVFQQSQCVDMTSESIQAQRLKEIIGYWVMRIAIALSPFCEYGIGIVATKTPSRTAPPTSVGLMLTDVRQRFYSYLHQRLGASLSTETLTSYSAQQLYDVGLMYFAQKEFLKAKSMFQAALTRTDNVHEPWMVQKITERITMCN